MRYPIRMLVLLGMVGLLCLTSVHSVQAAEDADAQAIAEKAVAFLRSRQGKDGGFSPKFGPGVTALVVAGMLRNGYKTDHPVVQKALEYLQSKVQKDGGIYEKRLANYTTCVAMMALTEGNKDGKFDTILKNASAFLRKLQQDDPANKEMALGGVGYDGKSRPDLSNTQFFIDSLLGAGVSKDDPAIQRAIKFVQRCQNFPDKEKGNDLPFAAKAREEDKGGFTYTPLDTDDSPHATPEGGLRSLGAMTYAGLKSYLYSGVKKDDPRVQGALRWIRKHYTLEENPGMKQSGLFYYYHTFAKTMEALGEERFKDANGVEHDWRKELLQALKKRQREDGSFLNREDRTFGEGDANLATAFALLSLSYTRKK
ncbi:MAG: prenyltransferase/squalene oxidase repeat-containing protein [Gemmataceae bacterium]